LLFHLHVNELTIFITFDKVCVQFGEQIIVRSEVVIMLINDFNYF
jgi:hypothetical protein